MPGVLGTACYSSSLTWVPGYSALSPCLSVCLSPSLLVYLSLWLDAVEHMGTCLHVISCVLECSPRFHRAQADATSGCFAIFTLALMLGVKRSTGDWQGLPV